MFKRYAVYFTPTGALADFGAAWLGWDLATGTVCTHPLADGLDVAGITATPRRYGLHATIKPPFRLALGKSADELRDAVAALCGRQRPVTLQGMSVQKMGRFLAVVPADGQAALNALAADVVRDLDGFRAPLNEAELAKRRMSRLTPMQEQNLLNWGYPYVIGQFRFHITLTGRLNKAELEQAHAVLAAELAPLLPPAFPIDSLTLAGEDQDGFFHEVQRFPLTGAP